MSAVASLRSKRNDPMQMKIPKNPRYKDVKATVDTGASLSKYMNKIEEIRKNYKFRKDEIFKRMKVTTFAQLVIQVHRISCMDEYDDAISAAGEDTFRPDTADRELQHVTYAASPAPSLALTDGDFGGQDLEVETGRSTLLSVARGVGELDLNKSEAPPSDRFVNDVCPYLLLDVRDKDEYSQCHVITAGNYPRALLSRATNYESKEMLAYKNKPGKIIVVYDEDERVAPMAATTLVERGYDNLFMLSGGLKVALQKFPEGLVTGSLPVHSPGKSRNILPVASQTTFTSQDTDKMEMYLDNALQDHSIGSRLSKSTTASSRMSKASSARSSVASQSGSVAGDRPPFR